MTNAIPARPHRHRYFAGARLRSHLLADDDRFLGALRNTVVYALVTTPVSVALALALAVALNRAMSGRGLVRTAVFLPFVASLSITSIAWSFLLDANVGAVIAWLEGIGIDTGNGNGLRDPRYALPAVVFVGIWRNVGFFMVMFLAGLQSFPREITEAAVVDGAGPCRRVRRYLCQCRVTQRRQDLLDVVGRGRRSRCSRPRARSRSGGTAGVCVGADEGGRGGCHALREVLAGSRAASAPRASRSPSWPGLGGDEGDLRRAQEAVRHDLAFHDVIRGG